jgi:ferritin-like metal-binding protein YciE
MTKANPKEHLADWLRDAHAMEQQSATMMRKLADRLEHYPELRGRIQRHIEETEQQAKRLEGCMKRAGAKTSALKDIAGKFTATIQGLSGVVVEDEVVKAHLAHYVFEHYEMASYRILIAAAEAAGDSETCGVCETNLREEEAMADWLADNLPATAQKYLQRDMADLDAKR